MKLRNYQIKIISELRSGFVKHKRQILCSPTGSGKTIMFSYIAFNALSKANKVCIVTDRIELCKQSYKAVSHHTNDFEVMTAGATISKDPKAIIAMVETLNNRIKKGWDWEPDLLIVDECFPSGTLIDGKPIENIKIGDYVNSFNHKKNIIEKRRVLNTFKKELIDTELIKINYLYDSIVCTREHPIFVLNKGYINAYEIQKSDKIILCNLPKKDNKRYCNFRGLVQRVKRWKYNLFEKMYFCISFSKIKEKQPDEIRYCKKKSKRDTKKNWTQTSNTWGEWKRAYFTSKKIIRIIARWMVSRINYKNRKRIFTLSLQNRYRKSIIKNCNRNRWCFSQRNIKKKTRFKKNKSFRIERVQSIEILKRSSFDSNSDGFKYNIEVEENNNYFANDLLVHNCHKGNFSKILDAWGKSFVIGATATPVGKHFHKYYTNLITPVDIPDLIELGFLSSCRAFQMQDDFSDLKRSRGDYTEESLFNHFDKPKLYTGVVEKWMERASGLRTLVFCVNIKHAEETNKAFLNAGINSDVITSKTPNDERERILKAHKQGLFPVLVNCGILTTGYDDPKIECIVMNRATLSLPLWLQCCGRGSRTTKEKNQFIVLDFGMNHNRHGLWQAERNWKIEAPKKKRLQEAPVKNCPKCDSMLHLSAMKCDFCGFVFPKKENKPINGVLVEQVPEDLKNRRLSELNLKELYQLQLSKRYKAAYIWRIVRSRGYQDLLTYAAMAGYSSGWIYRQSKELNNVQFKDFFI